MARCSESSRCGRCRMSSTFARTLVLALQFLICSACSCVAYGQTASGTLPCLTGDSMSLPDKDGVYYESPSAWVALRQPTPPRPIFAGSMGSFLFVGPDPDTINVEYKGAKANLRVEVSRPIFFLIESEDPDVRLALVMMVQAHDLRKATLNLKALDTDVLEVASEVGSKRRCVSVKRNLIDGEYLLIGFHSRYRENDLRGEAVFAYVFEFAVKANKIPH
jgi:hypothetical protein